MKKFLKGIKIPVFFLGLILILAMLSNIFRINDMREYQMMKSLCDAQENSLDAVYVGSSSTYTFWQAPIAWEKFGFAIQMLSVPAMPPQSLKYMIAEARKTQPDALYIINLNLFKSTELSAQTLHYTLDYMHFSANKLALTRELCEKAGFSGLDALEYYFPTIRFHSSWNALTSGRFRFTSEGIKGAVHYGTMSKTTDVLAGYQQTEELAELTEEQAEILDDLVGYIRENDVNALFVLVPQSQVDLTALGQFNMLAQTLEAEGFPVLNLTRSAEEIGLDFSTDYYNDLHTNFHGCFKYMDYLCRYLREHYDFTDKRGDPAYADWDEAVETYAGLVGIYTLDVERGPYERDYSLDRPTLTDAAVNGTEVTLTWQPAENAADGGVVYRKVGSGVWTRLAEVGDGVTSYTDSDTAANTQYTYTVIPVRYEDGQAYYGNFDYAGISATTEEADKAT